ncbi:hypothetical protein R6242_19805 [Iodobacter sp. CM08]|uniref:hypothetical protein n=1 Tax=Iodobacter sp. CM08 TaxID=3085902 RepID=UPI002980A420|nr:hypothetical protein [Iodobacter sp. CM08]MDW5418818.1 hypothetical protein [Iodobacter sp. CM08]
MKIFNFCLVVLCLALNACAGQNVQEANLTYVSLNKNRSMARLFFKSDVDFSKVIDEKKGQSIGSRTIQCSLTDDVNFTPGHSLQYFLEGQLSRSEGQDNIGFMYSSDLLFAMSDEENEKYRINKNINGMVLNDAFRAMIFNRKKIPCKVIVTVVYSSPYLSKIMYVPSKDLIDSFFNK